MDLLPFENFCNSIENQQDEVGIFEMGCLYDGNMKNNKNKCPIDTSVKDFPFFPEKSNCPSIRCECHYHEDDKGQESECGIGGFSFVYPKVSFDKLFRIGDYIRESMHECEYPDKNPYFFSERKEIPCEFAIENFCKKWKKKNKPEKPESNFSGDFCSVWKECQREYEN